MEPSAFFAWWEERESQPFNLIVMWWAYDYPDASNSHSQALDSQADGLHAHWRNDEFDRLVRAAAVNPDDEERIAQYRQAEEILAHDAAYIPLYHLASMYLVKPFVRDFVGMWVPTAILLRYAWIAEH